LNKFLMRAAAFCALIVAPSVADAAVRGYATANVNMRSGPSTAYPAVTVIPVGSSVTIYGCMSSVNWCDVAFPGGRGWVSGTYVQASYRSNRVYVAPDYYNGLGIPLVTFDVDRYWGTYYRDRNFYRDRDRWRRYDFDRADRRPPPPPRWDDGRRPPPPPGWDRDRDRDRWDRDRDRWDRDRDRSDWDRNRDRDRDRDRDRSDRDRNRDRDREEGRRPPPPPGFDRDRNDRRDPPRAERPREEQPRAERSREERPRVERPERPERRDAPSSERARGDGRVIVPDEKRSVWDH
jgi:uncharacterized protein YraI